MSYSPRTKLSCDVSACTVLTDGYVFVSSGLAANQRMPLADWEILIDGATIRDEYIPLERDESMPLERDESIPVPLPAVEAQQESTDPIRTKWRWSATENPSSNYRVAIQTKKGVLQVKQVSSFYPHGLDYQCDVRPKMFETYEAWFSSLPEGSVSKTLPEDNLTPLERRKQQSVELLANGATASAIAKLQALWKVHTTVYHLSSVNQRIACIEDNIARMRGELGMVTLEQDITTPK